MVIMWCNVPCLLSRASRHSTAPVLIVCSMQKKGRRPGESYHVIQGMADITDSRYNSLFTFLSTASKKIRKLKYVPEDNSYLRTHLVSKLNCWGMAVIIRVQSCKQQKLCDLEIAHQCCMMSRLCIDAAQSRTCVILVHNPEIGTQFPDSENVQHNLEIAQIPRLHGTDIYIR